MTVTLNEAAFDHAKRLIMDREFVLDDRGAWSEHQPTAAQEKQFIDTHGYGEYGRWHLGVHRCGVLAAESRASQRNHPVMERAAAHLHGMLDAPR